MTKIKCCKIHLMPAARDRAARALYDGAAYGSKAAKEFTGPDFQNIEACYSNGDCINVILPDGSAYIYPMHQVARVKIYDREVVA